MSRPVGGVLSTGPLRGSGWVAIHLCGPPGSVDGRDALSTLGLAPDGVCRAARVAPDAGALLPHRFTLTCAPDTEVGAIGGLFSVALSCGSPRLAASQHPSLRSPDLPQRHPVGAMPRPPGRLTVVHSLLERSAGWQRGIGFRRIDGGGRLAATGARQGPTSRNLGRIAPIGACTGPQGGLALRRSWKRTPQPPLPHERLQQTPAASRAVTPRWPGRTGEPVEAWTR